MKKTILISMVLCSSTLFASNYDLGNEKWSSKLLLETCSKQLKQSVKYVQRKLNKNKKYVAIIPETIGYKYFNVEFKEVVDNMALPKNSSRSFTQQFEYWSVDDAHSRCNRIEPTEFIY